jgi:hypothetical protein
MAVQLLMLSVGLGITTEYSYSRTALPFWRRWFSEGSQWGGLVPIQAQAQAQAQAQTQTQATAALPMPTYVMSAPKVRSVHLSKKSLA